MTDDKITDMFEEVQYGLEQAHELFARGEYMRSDSLLFGLRDKFNALHYELWLKHHRSGFGKI